MVNLERSEGRSFCETCKAGNRLGAVPGRNSDTPTIVATGSRQRSLRAPAQQLKTPFGGVRRAHANRIGEEPRGSSRDAFLVQVMLASQRSLPPESE